MKTISKILVIGLMLVFGISNAQTSSQSADKSKLALAVWVSDQIEGITPIAKKNLENKLTQILIENGLTNDAYNSRFILTANINVLTKDITPTAPPMQAYTLNITFYIGDGIEGRAFSSYSTTVKGVGENETKAYLAALKNIKTNDPAYQTFIDKAKGKIIDYYNTQCDQIIKDANVLAGLRKYDEAIWKLTGVPSVCSVCWDKCMSALAPIYKQKIDYDCKMKVSEATNIWNAGQSWDAAEQAGAILKTIDPSATCIGEAKALSDKISKKINEVDKREWNLIYESEVGVQKDLIQAYKEIGVAWGKNQPQNVTYKTLW